MQNLSDALLKTAVVLDLDDTLYPERHYAHAGFAAASAWAQSAFALRDAQRSALLAEMVGHLASGTLGPLFAASLATVRPHASSDDHAAFIRAYGNASPAIRLFDDAERWLHGAHGSVAVGLITDGHARTQAKKIASLGLDGRFPHVVLTGALGPDRAFHKPHPRAFEHIAQAIGAGRRFVYVGDNVSKDFIAPNALGWVSVHIVRSGLAEDSLPIHREANGPAPSGGAPHFTIATFDDLSTVLEL